MTAALCCTSSNRNSDLSSATLSVGRDTHPSPPITSTRNVDILETFLVSQTQNRVIDRVSKQ